MCDIRSLGCLFCWWHFVIFMLFIHDNVVSVTVGVTRFHYAARTWDVVRKSQLLAEYSRLQSWTTPHRITTTDVTHVTIYSSERWEAHRPAGRPSGSEVQLEQWNLIIVTSPLLLQSCRHLCGRGRDYVHSWRVSCAEAQQRYCTADIHSSRLHKEVLITLLPTTNMVLRKAEVMAVLLEPIYCAGMTEWLCWSECVRTTAAVWRSLPASMRV